MQDHQEVKKLFRKAERMESGDRQLQEIVETACAALAQHAEIEEQIFYPAVREATEDEDALEEALVEHDSAKQLIAQLESMGARDERYKATFKVLGEYVNHHVEEEEGKIFRLARRAKLDMEALGEQIMMAKQGGEAGAGETGGASEGAESERGAQRGGARGSRSGSASESSRSRSRGGGRGSSSRGGDSAQASESGESDDDQGDAMTTGRTGGDTSEDTERPGRGGRSARSSVEDADDEEIDVETPGGSSRYGSH